LILAEAGNESPLTRNRERLMAQYNSVLVPVDIAEPDTARPALECAVDLAHASNGTIRLIYVRSILP
jgi:nucleotide-binding universal stress UspA family protein